MHVATYCQVTTVVIAVYVLAEALRISHARTLVNSTASTLAHRALMAMSRPGRRPPLVCRQAPSTRAQAKRAVMLAAGSTDAPPRYPEMASPERSLGGPAHRNLYRMEAYAKLSSRSKTPRTSWMSRWQSGWERKARVLWRYEISAASTYGKSILYCEMMS